MANVLFLAHRLPYPPDKGDKIRSYHLMEHLAATHRVFLGTFVDDEDDLRHVPAVASISADSHIARLRPRVARLRSLGGLMKGEALTVRYYRDAGLRRWVDALVENARIDAAVVFSSAMAQYVAASPRIRLLVDFVDVDSAKWSGYARLHRGPSAWLYAREGRRLLAWERAVAARANRSFFVTDHEADLFRALAPECAAAVRVIGNGVDAAFFAPQPDLPSPFEAGEIPIVFTGAMDYFPNADGAAWFAAEVLPGLRRVWPHLRFHVVGRNPSAAVRALAGEAVRVSGTVPDVRPYLQHAAVVVAPLRVARGVQNKVLEAMAMARPVVVTAACMSGIDAEAGRELHAAADAAGFGAAVDALLRDADAAAAVGRAARRRVVERYNWRSRLAAIDRYLAAADIGSAS